MAFVFLFPSRSTRFEIQGSLPYLFELLQTGRRHVRVPSEFGASRWRQSGAEATDLASALAAEPRVAVPPLKSLEDRNLEQRIGRFLRHDRLVPGRELPPAHAAPPRRLEKMILDSIVQLNHSNLSHDESRMGL